MSTPERGRVLLSVTGFNPQRWYDLLSKEREVVLEPDGTEDPSIDYAVVWKHQPGVLARLPNLKVIFSIGAGVDHIFAEGSAHVRATAPRAVRKSVALEASAVPTRCAAPTS